MPPPAERAWKPALRVTIGASGGAVRLVGAGGRGRQAPGPAGVIAAAALCMSPVDHDGDTIRCAARGSASPTLKPPNYGKAPRAKISRPGTVPYGRTSPPSRSTACTPATIWSRESSRGPGDERPFQGDAPGPLADACFCQEPVARPEFLALKERPERGLSVAHVSLTGMERGRGRQCPLPRAPAGGSRSCQKWSRLTGLAFAGDWRA